MKIDAAKFQKLLGEFNLVKLFNELGWELPNLKPHTATVNGEAFTLTNVAHKRGVAVFLCSPDSTGKVPARPILLKLEREAAKIAHEHLLVFADANQTMLTWLWVARTPGQPSTTRTHTWYKSQSGEALRQKLSQIVWSLEEEETITLTDVITNLRNAFDRDRISKSFYEKFKTQHESFVGFIEGLSTSSEKGWYASLMLNRLMFVYFIQKKGFLDGDHNYLANRLTQLQAAGGKDKFHSFYRQFLRRLFHEGLGQAKAQRHPDIAGLIGDVPYLNGGLFSMHELEQANTDIDVPDEAFERLFAFLDAWEWHLDDRPLASGRDINPDVLGYIFEKYINQKQMGAYYTKEDITEYISKSSVIPHLLQRAQEGCQVAFQGEVSLWSLLRTEPDRYIYPTMKIGVLDANGNVVPESTLPDFVQAGIKDPKARMFDRRFNLGEAAFHTATGERGTLPTETWREYLDRRARCLALRDKLASGEVKSANDLISFNLDSRQFMQDVINSTTSPDLLRAIWHAIVGRVPTEDNAKFSHGITILDPTCGSGAFLFAALNILEPLYEACLERMEGFIEDAEKLGKEGEADFTQVLAAVNQHTSRRYYIFKNIILHNLFGVDIMAEAVEICKLRLFLKLVSQVDTGQELEPLPDIDFNIRVGNTLIGYATEAQFGAAHSLASDHARRTEITTSMSRLADSFDHFRARQLEYGGQITARDKRELRDKLAALNGELDRYLAHDYGIDPDQGAAFAAWRDSHQPFHWFAQFYGVMREGGFDVVIGNPPYVEVKDIANAYALTGFSTQECGNLYAMCSERALSLLHPESGKFGFIIPVASTCTDGYASLKAEFLKAGTCFISSYNDRPGRLFDGLEHIRLAIILVHRGPQKTFTTKYNKWSTTAREHLFPTLQYQEHIAELSWAGSVPKINSNIETLILKDINKGAMPVAVFAKKRQPYRIYYTRKLSGFVQVLDFVPSIIDNTGNERPPSELKELTFADRETAGLVLALLNSSLFYWFLTLYSDVRNLNKREVQGFPVSRLPQEAVEKIAELGRQLMASFQGSSKVLTMRYQKHGTLAIQCIYPKHSKEIIDQIDIAYGRAIGLTDEALDFVINYDIKYRMSGTAEGD